MPLHIGIAGCGVAGLTAALLLARQGHRVTLHEQAPTLGPVGAGVLLQPSGQIILHKMNLLAATIAAAEPIDRLTAFTHRHKQLIDLPYSELPSTPNSDAPPPRAYGLLRSDLFSALHTAALAAGVAMRTGERITHYTRRPDGAYFLQIPENPPQSSRTHPPNSLATHGPYDFLLAADGSRSTLRQNSPLPSRVIPYPHGALWAMGQCTTVSRRLLQISHGTRHLCGLLPTGNHRASLFWGIRNDEMPALRQRGFSAWRDQVLTLSPHAAELFTDPAGITSFDSVQFVSYQRVHMKTPFDNTCLFVGDAAHAMSPHLGQGINLALIDGYTFAQSLATTPDFPTACQLYTQSRSAHLRAYQLITYLLSPFFQSPGKIKGWGRDIALPLMPKIPFLRRQMIQTMSGCRADLLGKNWQCES